MSKVNFFLENFEKKSIFLSFRKIIFFKRIFKQKISLKYFIWHSKKKISVKKNFQFFYEKKIFQNFFQISEKKISKYLFCIAN